MYMQKLLGTFSILKIIFPRFYDLKRVKKHCANEFSNNCSNKTTLVESVLNVWYLLSRKPKVFQWLHSVKTVNFRRFSPRKVASRLHITFVRPKKQQE